MEPDLGPQYAPDDPFKAAARLHQSTFRASVLGLDYQDYGNRLTDPDAQALHNYYDGLGVRRALRRRYPKYSRMRDADMLRSEHIPFNMFAPLQGRPELTQRVLHEAFGLQLSGPFTVCLEWAPSPSRSYLDDRTSFDTYIEGTGSHGGRVGVGIEVKYTEQAYRMGASEAARVGDPESSYWRTTRGAGAFVDGGSARLGEDTLRQIWRNHLLGLAMTREGDVAEFVSITVHPSGNQHFVHALAAYLDELVAPARSSVFGCTFARLIGGLEGGPEIEAWREYLKARYVVA